MDMKMKMSPKIKSQACAKTYADRHKIKKIFQTRMSLAPFVAMIENDIVQNNEKKTEITSKDLHLTLALPIGGRKVEEFYGKKPKEHEYNKVLTAWRKKLNLEDGTPKLRVNDTDTGESFKRNLVLYMVPYFFNGSNNIHYPPYFMINVANFGGPILFLKVSSVFFISIIY
ncbi:hypothetical protein Cgig2_032646 [Carnegiea gigantea]|uniref:Uncharacterized protein n=1 Tax=Carnegiea gigantea TaxID=171969 RepID=A0A9Q1GV94_9CARY|nr:hypothetical protein Cgig2_032646 [Carnegiea gigantea]